MKKLKPFGLTMPQEMAEVIVYLQHHPHGDKAARVDRMLAMNGLGLQVAVIDGALWYVTPSGEPTCKVDNWSPRKKLVQAISLVKGLGACRGRVDSGFKLPYTPTSRYGTFWLNMLDAEALSLTAFAWLVETGRAKCFDE